MLATTSALLLAGCQWVRPDPLIGVAGEPAAAVVHARDGGPWAGQTVALRGPDGTTRTLGVSDARGRVAFVPESPGDHVLVVEPAGAGGVALLSPFHAVPPRSRWLRLAIWVPLGLGVLAFGVRALVRAGRGDLRR